VAVKPMKLLFTFALLFTTTLCFAQRQNVYFLKNNGKYVDVRDSADYVMVVREPDSASTLYNVSEFYPNGANKLIGKSSVINPPKFEGSCIQYYANGKRKSIGSYRAGLIAGDEYEFYTNGKAYLVKNYSVNTDVNNQLQDNYSITAEYDSLGNALVTDGNGYYKGFDEHFKTITEEGNLQNGQHTGVWKGKDSGLKITYIENYDKGLLISGTSLSEKGDSVKYSKSREVEPQYKGGVNAFTNYISRNINYPDYERAHNIQGKVILKFIVEKNGKVSNVEVLNSVSVAIDKEAVRVISESADWMPGTEYGRKVRVYYTIPLNFALSD
jgi:TonB family protein